MTVGVLALLDGDGPARGLAAGFEEEGVPLDGGTAIGRGRSRWHAKPPGARHSGSVSARTPARLVLGTGRCARDAPI